MTRCAGVLFGFRRNRLLGKVREQGHQAASGPACVAGGRGTSDGHSAPSGQFSANQRRAL